MWMVFLFILGIIGIVLINIFGNITTTNQQDFTLIRNMTEAAMEDAKDWGSYQTGFYLCITNDKIVPDEKGLYTFKSKDDYKIIRTENGATLNLKDKSNDKKCDYIVRETIINKDVFVESFLRRFAEDVNNNKSYRVTVQEVIEYPPKVSIRIDTFNTYNATDSTTVTFTEGDFTIQNQVDAIFEEK